MMFWSAEEQVFPATAAKSFEEVVFHKHGIFHVRARVAKLPKAVSGKRKVEGIEVTLIGREGLAPLEEEAVTWLSLERDRTVPEVVEAALTEHGCVATWSWDKSAQGVYHGEFSSNSTSGKRVSDSGASRCK